MTRKERRRAGSTLLELLIVLVLISTLASLVAVGTGRDVFPPPSTAGRDSLRSAIRNGTSIPLYNARDDGLILLSTSYANGLVIVDTLRPGREEDRDAAPAQP